MSEIELVCCSICGKFVLSDDAYGIADYRTESIEEHICRPCWEKARKINDYIAEIERLKGDKNDAEKVDKNDAENVTSTTSAEPVLCGQKSGQKTGQKSGQKTGQKHDKIRSRIIAELQEGTSMAKTAKKFGVSPRTVSRIKRESECR